MSQLALPVPVHIELGPEATILGSLMFASVKQPTWVLPVQRPAPCGHTHELMAALERAEAEIPAPGNKQNNGQRT